jgi:hypothetical protein
MVKDVVGEMRMPVPVRHLNYTGEEARRFAATYGLEPGTAKEVARKAAVDIDWDEVYASINGSVPKDSSPQNESCCATMADQWSKELDELLRPCEVKAKAAGIMMTPVLVIGDRCVHQGSVPEREQVVEWVKDFCGGLADLEQDNCVVEVLGPGCPKCDQLYQNVTEAVSRANMQEKVTVTKRKDIGYFREMGVAFTPALVIDGQVVSKGKVLAEDKIFDILRKEQG